MKLRKLSILFLVILFTVLQCTALSYLKIFEVKPDILLILIIFFGLYHGRVYGLAVGALSGFFSEVTCGIPSGFAVCTYTLAGLILGHIGRWIYNPKILSVIFISFISSFAIYFFIFFLLRASDINLPLLNTLTYTILPTSVYTAFISPLLFRFLKTIPI